MKKYIDLSANQLTDDRMQSVSLEPEQTSHSSLKTNFCCCRCTTKVKYNYTPMRILHILFYPVGSRDICCHIGGISPGSAWFRMIRIPMQISDEMPGLQLPSQLQNVTANWPVSNYTAWWQRHTGVSGLPKATMQWCPVTTRTRDLWIASPMSYQQRHHLTPITYHIDFMVSVNNHYTHWRNVCICL